MNNENNQLTDVGPNPLYQPDTAELLIIQIEKDKARKRLNFFQVPLEHQELLIDMVGLAASNGYREGKK